MSSAGKPKGLPRGTGHGLHPGIARLRIGGDPNHCLSLLIDHPASVCCDRQRSPGSSAGFVGWISVTDETSIGPWEWQAAQCRPPG